MSNFDELSSARRQKLDRYEILAEIASGGMATVYVGRIASTGFERLVAIKRLHPHLEREREFVEMFLDEARIAARIHHPNVVSTLEFGGSPERGHYLVMDYVEGTTLAKLLAKAAQSGERIPQPVALRIVLDTLSGLHVAHELTGEDGRPMNIVHRDVSPQNILVGVDGTARITDFGVAHAAERLAVTRTGQLKGKLGYMAPEQAKGEPTDRRADVFAMGIILWETLASRRLFRGKTETDAETLSRVLYADIPHLSEVLPDVTPLLDQVVSRALERPIGERFPSCADFIDALENVAQQGARVGSPREVAKYMEQVVGRETEQRRAALRKMAPGADGDGRLMDDIPTSAEVPRLISSVSSASMAVAEASQASRVSQVFIPAEPPRAQPLMMGALAALLLVTVAAVATMVYVVAITRPAASAAAGAPAVDAARTPTGVAARPLPSAEASAVPSATTAAPPDSASAAPPASAAPRALPVGVVPGPMPTLKPTKPPKSDGLSSNPYRP
jgi:eukaryotic-like serine/threonine-protein kinase